MKILIIITILFLLTHAAIWWTATPTLRRHIGGGFLLSYFGPLYLGMVIPQAYVFLGAVIIMFVATTRDRQDAACRFIMLALLFPPVTWRISLPGAYLGDFGLVTALSIALLIKCMVKPDRSPAPSRGLSVEDGFMLLFFVLYFIGGDRPTTISGALRGAVSEGFTLLLPYFALRRSIRSSTELMRVVACLAVGSVVLGVFAFYEARHGWTLFDFYRSVGDVAGRNHNLITRGGLVRAAVTMGGALMLSIVLLSGLAASFYSRAYVRQGWMIVGWGTAIFLGLISTQSRGSLLLLPLSALIFFLCRRKFGYAALIAIGAPMVLGVVFALAQVSPQVGALTKIGPFAPANPYGVYDYRQLFLTRGLEEAAKHRWFGTSLQQVVAQLDDITQGQHIVDMVNTYLTLYLISGLLGLIPLVMLLATVWIKLGSQNVPRSDPELVDTRAFALTILGLITFQLAYMSLIDRLPLSMALALAAARIVRLEPRRRRREATRSAAVQTVAAPRPRPVRVSMPTPDLA